MTKKSRSGAKPSERSDAAWWTTRLCDWTGNNDTKFNNFGVLRGNGNSYSGGASQQWYDWIYKRVADNVSYDQLIDGLVTGESRLPNESYAEYCGAMTKKTEPNSPNG